MDFAVWCGEKVTRTHRRKLLALRGRIAVGTGGWAEWPGHVPAVENRSRGSPQGGVEHGSEGMARRPGRRRECACAGCLGTAGVGGWLERAELSGGAFCRACYFCRAGG